MQFKTIGNTKVPVIGQGTGKVKDENIIRLGIEQGLTFIDTSETYGNEEIIAKAIKGKRDKVFISDKFAPEHNGYDDVIKACEASLKRLGTDYIDLYSMYYPNPNIDIDETITAIEHLGLDGKIRYGGYCNVGSKFIESLKGGAIQLEYNLFDRSIEDSILPYCERNNILTVAYSPLLDWELLDPGAVVWVMEIALNHQSGIRQVILAWLVSRKSVIVIPRSNNPKHIIENARAGDLILSQAEIDQISKMFPYESQYIDPKLINISLNADTIPQTKEQALRKWPTVGKVSLEDFKPVRVTYTWEKTYEIKEGAFRYWSWILQSDKPIPVIVKKRWLLEPEGGKKGIQLKCKEHPESPVMEINGNKFCSKCYNEFLIRSVGALRGDI